MESRGFVDIGVFGCTNATYSTVREYSPADVVYGDVSQLLVHGRLALLARITAKG